MSTLSEMVKQVRKEQVIAQQNISSTISQPSQPIEILKVKIETTEELKASSPHQSTARVELFNDSESARLLIQALKKKGFNVREEEKKEEELLEIVPIVSWEQHGKTGKFLIVYQNGVQEYLSADRIVTLVLDDLRAILKIPLKNDSNNEIGEFIKDAMHRQLGSLSSSESSEEEGDKEKEEKFFGNEEEPDSNDNNEILADTEVPLDKSQVPISEWYYDQELKKFVIKRLDFTYFVFSEFVDLSVLSPVELKLLSLMPMSTTTEEGPYCKKESGNQCGQSEVKKMQYLSLSMFTSLHGNIQMDIIRVLPKNKATEKVDTKVYWILMGTIARYESLL
ncbi:hypothetical protein L1987_20697 [Smallanthus sonchifolius]|uniref:Uncharacterized protein n=1 Tax=Smallanthus sonchifolius TaxID=185202 RepID=A0ACB9IRU4_9ASTR|nr:hypothetical protein L1987_20697 [Smallanthus sonchifolius]